MAALASPGDWLWTMEPLPDELAPEGIRLCSGPPAELPGFDEAGFDALVPWGQAEPWATPQDSSSAARCNDRRFGLALAKKLRCALPSSRVIQSLDELDAHLADPGTTLGPLDSWVVKAPFSASGRERVKRRGRQLEGELRVRTERLIARYGSLVFEPWMERELDLGLVGEVGGTVESSLLHAPHELINDDSGVFRAIRVDDQWANESLSTAMRDKLEQVSAAVIDSLHRAGYRGPFGIDAFVYLDEGERRLHPLCEINARYTFGHLARAKAKGESYLLEL